MNLSIVIPYRGDNGWRDILFKFHLNRINKLFPNSDIRISDSFTQSFSRSQARNIGVIEAINEDILLLDADTIFNKQQILDGLELLNLNNESWVIPYKTYFNLNQQFTMSILNSKTSDDLPPIIDKDWEHKLQSWAGVCLIKKTDFIKHEGYDERFIGWGYEDNAFQCKMDCLISPHLRVTGDVYHLWHPRSSEENFNQPYINYNRTLYEKYKRAKNNRSKMLELLNK